MYINQFRTGDILLYNTNRWYSRIIEYFLGKSYSHISMILKDPADWLDPSLNQEDLYVLESGYEQDEITGKITFGVQIIPFSTVYDQYKYNNYGELYHRRLRISFDTITLQTRIKNAYEKVKNKPYDIDPIDWIFGYYELNKNIDNSSYLSKYYQKTSSFWCSALVSYIFVECEILDKNIAWSLVAPIDYVNYRTGLIEENRKLPMINNCRFGLMHKIC